ncbi:MAG TPA: BON domain-containing protein [Burkholderiales bacterium]|nr:BON domain-containing protein [Burkholderiales bacterium]
MTLPERLGKYEVVEALGESANAEVFGAFDPDVNRVVAVKTIRKDLAQLDGRAARALARWRNESRLAGRLSHPGIVAVYDYGESGSVAYLAMEFVQGHRLGEYLARGIQFGEADAVSIVAQVLDALQHAHEHGVRHGAVNPASIVITRSGEAKLTEFGGAATEDGSGPEPDEDAGDPGYVAPELYAGEGVDARADLFAAGALFFRLLTGRPAYRGSAEQVAYRVSRGSVPLPSEVGPGRGWERYDALVSRALAREADERFQTASEFRRALLDAYGAPLAAVATPRSNDGAASTGNAEPGDMPSRSLWVPGRIALEEEQLQAHLRDGPPAFHANSDDGRWRVALIAAVVLIALAVVAGLAYWTAPDFGPRTARPDRASTPQPDATRASPALVPGREARPDTAPGIGTMSQGVGAVAEADRRTVDSSAGIVRQPEPLEPLLAPPAPIAAARSEPLAPEPPTVQPAVPAERKVAAAPPSQTSGTRTEVPASPDATTSFWRDQAIAFQVATRMGFNRDLYRSRIQVESAGGVVTLRGHVPSREHAAQAIAVAREINGVREVRSELRVGAPEYVFPDPSIGLQ